MIPLFNHFHHYFNTLSSPILALSRFLHLVVPVMLVHSDVLIDKFIHLTIDFLRQLPPGYPSIANDQKHPKQYSHNNNKDNPSGQRTLLGRHIARTSLRFLIQTITNNLINLKRLQIPPIDNIIDDDTRIINNRIIILLLRKPIQNLVVLSPKWIIHLLIYLATTYPQILHYLARTCLHYR